MKLPNGILQPKHKGTEMRFLAEQVGVDWLANRRKKITSFRKIRNELVLTVESYQI